MPAIMQKKIYYHDTDAGGVVYYANYLRHCEEARTEYLLNIGVDKAALAAAGILFVVGRIAVEYRAPARYLETVIVSSRICRMTRVAVVFEQIIRRNEQVLVEALITTICVDSTFRACSLPDAIRQVIQQDMSQSEHCQ